MSYQQYRPSGFRILPPAVKNLLIINMILFFATYVFDTSMFRVDLVELLGLHYFGSQAFQPYQVITYMFMHGGFTHIFFNMFAVWMFGNALENYWGAKRFLIYYFFTGIGASVIHYVIMYYFDIAPVLQQINVFLAEPSVNRFNEFLNSPYFGGVSQELRIRFNEFYPVYTQQLMTDPDLALQSAVDFMLFYKNEFLDAPVVIGASGAVFGILLAFGMLFPNTVIYLYFAIPVKAKWVVIAYGALELYAGITNEGSNVAHFAHLGGMVFGFILLMYWRRRSQRQFFQ